MSTTVTVSVRSPSATIIVSAGSSTLQVSANGQVIWSSSNPPSSPPEVPQGATLTFSGTATDSGGHPFANTVFYFFTQGPIPSSGTPPAPTSQSVTTDSSGNWSVTVQTSGLQAGSYNFWLDANPSGA